MIYNRCKGEKRISIKRTDTKNPKTIDTEKSISQEYTKLVKNSDKIHRNNLPKFESIRKGLIDSNESRENFEGINECACKMTKQHHKRRASPCAKIKNFFRVKKRFLRIDDSVSSDVERRKVTESRKRRKKKETKRKNGPMDGRKSAKKKLTSGGRKRVRSERKNQRKLEKSQSLGRTCEICKLLNRTGDEKFEDS